MLRPVSVGFVDAKRIITFGCLTNLFLHSTLTLNCSESAERPTVKHRECQSGLEKLTCCLSSSYGVGDSDG
jgi:hypothetical protein